MSNIDTAAQALLDALDKLRTEAQRISNALTALGIEPRTYERTPVIIPQLGLAPHPTKKAAIKAAKTVAAKPVKNELPPTGVEWFNDLLTTEPQTKAQLVEAAVAKIGFTPNKEQLEKLKSRITWYITQEAKKKEGLLASKGAKASRTFMRK